MLKFSYLTFIFMNLNFIYNMDLLKADLLELNNADKNQALLLFQSNYKNLLKSNDNHKQTIIKLSRELEQYQQVRFNIKVENTILKQLMFGKKSERMGGSEEDDKQSELFENTKKEKKKRKKQKRAKDQNLETEFCKVEFDVIPDCEHCNTTLREMKDQFEQSTEITVIERQYKKRVYLRQKPCPASLAAVICLRKNLWVTTARSPALVRNLKIIRLAESILQNVFVRN